MLIHVKLGVPEGYHVNLEDIRATFPYGRLLPVEIAAGGLTYGCGRRDQPDAFRMPLIPDAKHHWTSRVAAG